MLIEHKLGIKLLVYLQLEHGAQFLLPDLQRADFSGESRDRGAETLVLLLYTTNKKRSEATDVTWQQLISSFNLHRHMQGLTLTKNRH